MSKKKVFKMPYIGIETADDQLHILLGTKGEPSAVLKMTNPVLQYCADPDEYLKFHQNLLNVIKILGEGYLLQKLDVLSKGKYEGDHSREYLQQKYDEHFRGRVYTIIHSYLVITKPSIKKQAAKKNEFKEAVVKVTQALQMGGLNPRVLKQREIDLLTLRILTMDFQSKSLVLDNFAPSDTGIRIGEKQVRCLSLIDIDRIDLPEKVAPYIERSDNEAMKGFPVDTMAFLHRVPEYDTIVYNQVIDIPQQVQTIQKLQIKQKRHSGIPDPGNDLCVTDIEKLLEDVARENQLLVNAHFSLLICAGEKQLQKTVNFVENALFLQGIIPSRNSYNQLELFRAALPGNGVELKNYDLYLTTSDAALTFFFKEALPVSEPAPKGFSIRFTDRQGVPVKIDPADYSRDIGRINNRNKFVLGPSGSGKSFFMNALIEQYLLYNMDVVIVDTGDSYSGTSAYLGGKYITYRQDKPITMNPFVIAKEEYNLEKKDFLSTLTGLLWKGADGKLSQVEADVISNVIIAYYKNCFEQKEKSWIDQATIPQLEEHLQDYGVNTELLFEEAKESLMPEAVETEKDYYLILGLTSGATEEEIRSAYRALAKVHHPDRNIQPDGTVSDPDLFISITEAYEILSNPGRRKDYDLTRQLTKLNWSANHSDWQSAGTAELEKVYSDILSRKTRELESRFKVKSLSFNSFYEFALFLIPLILKKNEIAFDFPSFRYVLRKFYKGGEFESILNEQADSSLFSERLIVFEIDNIKGNATLFPIVTLIIMDVFLQKMRFRQEQRKALVIEEAWKAIASPMMAGYILYLYKTVRKFNGEAIVVTQELDDIIGNAVVKDSIISNSDTICLLDQTKFKDNYQMVEKLLSISEVEKRKIFTINNLDNKENRGPFKEVYIRRGSTGEVYGVEVSLYQYLCYTTEKPEKLAVETYANTYGNYPDGLDHFVGDLKKSGLSSAGFVMLVNMSGRPLTDQTFDVLGDYQNRYGSHAAIQMQKDFQATKMEFTQWLEYQSKTTVPAG
ncbi:MAG: DnaJ domain-containing protein [Mangrovibacterium sp.]